jgi:hypothetical protein
MTPRPICALLLFFIFGTAARAEDSTTAPAPQVQKPAQLSFEVEPSAHTRCLELVYNRYATRGQSARNAWNNAVRDCSDGMDVSCVERAYRHYAALGQSDTQAYNNARRDCRTLTQRRW